MGLCCSKPDSEDTPSSSPSASPSAAAAAGNPLRVNGEQQVVERAGYDTDMRQHLISHSTPHTVELTITAAAVFAARARLAHDVVERRQADGCESSVALARSPSVAAHKEEALRAQMSREEKITDGLKLLIQRVDNVGIKVIHMEDDGNCQFRSLAQELYGDQELHGVVRGKVIEHLRANGDNYSFYVGDDAEWAAYLER